MDRRTFLKRLTLGGLAAAGAAVGGFSYSRWLEPFWLTTERVRVPIAGLNPALEGLRIVQVSDFHAGQMVPFEYLEQVVSEVNDLQPQLIALTGDFVTSRRDLQALPQLAELLQELRAEYGVYACLGNHDIWAGATRIIRELERSGIPVLVNSHTTLQIGSASLVVAGVDDPWGGQTNIQRALQGAPDTDTLLLSHSPDMIDHWGHQHKLLQLSGHTHGGQVRLPFFGAPILPRFGKRYDMGLFRVGESWLYVNRGVGMSSIPVRFACRPEITELSLTIAAT